MKEVKEAESWPRCEGCSGRGRLLDEERSCRREVDCLRAVL